MADSIQKAAGAGVKITLGGKEYDLKPYTVGDFIALREHITSGRIRAFAASSAEVSGSERVQVLTRLAEGMYSEYDMFAEAASPSGTLFLLWRRLRKTDPSLTLDDVSALVESDKTWNLEEISAITKELTKADEPPADPPAAAIS